MRDNTQRGFAFLAGTASALLCGAPIVLADDTELFVYDASALEVNPNVLFIFDTSGSMDARVESQESYDPENSYEGACNASRLYWRDDTGNPPDCDTDRWIDVLVFTCQAGPLSGASTAGRLTNQFAQFDPSTAEWLELGESNSDFSVECADDSGIHGDGTGPAVYATNGDSDAMWSSSAEDEINWSSRATYTVYSANYLNWYHGATGPSTRLQVMKDVATGLVGGINGVNVGLMRYNGHQGGRLVHAVANVTENRAGLLDAIGDLPASGQSPLSETLYEAALYFRGNAPEFGDSSSLIGMSGATYQSPISHACQKSYIVYLTDGEPSEDEDATELAPLLPGFVEAVGPSCDGTGDGACLDDLAAYLHEADLSESLPGKQSVTTYTIGFALDLPLLAETAAAGGGRYYTADDSETLTQALTNIVTSILETQATFTSPAVSINMFNRTRHLNDLFITVFQPTDRLHWPGNLKKYRLNPEDATIVDADGRPAVDESGYFSESARSVWSSEPDGRRVTRGGAASQLPPPEERNVYTDLVASGLAAPANAISVDNDLLTADELGLGDEGDPTRADVIEFIRGRDAGDWNQDGSTSDARGQMGDPLHAQPISLIYGGAPSDPDPDDALVFLATNDGYLHAIDAATGVEQWAFVPRDFLSDQADLLVNPESAAKHYGIDGSLRLHVLADDDGVLDATAGEKAYLYFGMRRGGSTYYALDVSNPDAPEVLWRLDGEHLPGLGQTWSSPVPTRIRIGEGASQNDEHSVVVLAGGYDETQDNHDASEDTLGNALYIVDAVSGDLLWHGGESDATRNFADMRYSIPADVRVIDLDGDGYADRMYAGDMGGQVWRFDIFNGNGSATLVTGGVLARLGSAGISSPERADTRRFYYAPDVALASASGSSFLHIGIGSGYRARPNSADNDDRFYALRDYAVFNHLSQAEFDARPVIDEDDLMDVTGSIDADLAYGSPGWMLRLGDGEKVLAEARTFNNQVFFTTFTPGAAAPNDCVPRLGTNRLYVLDLLDGSPVNNLDGTLDEEELTIEDRSREFQGSIASEVVFLFPSAAEGTESCVGEGCSPHPVVCVDLFCFPTGFGNSPIRTFWRQESVD